MSCRCAHIKRLKEAGAVFEEKSAVYMDYNAGCPPDRRILARYQNNALKYWAHPSSPHLAGAGSYAVLEEAERLCMSLTGKRFESLQFCRGAGDALQRLFSGAGACSRALISTAADHDALLNQAAAAAERLHKPFLLTPVDSRGKIKQDHLERLLKENPGSLLAYSPVNHETGCLQDGAGIFSLARSCGAVVFLDGAQAAMRLPLEAWIPYGHGICLSGQKIYGLKGTGLLLYGGPLKGMQEPEGTPDVPGADAMAAALAFHTETLAAERQRLSLLAREGMAILEELPIRRLSPPDAAPGVLCVSLPGLAAADAGMEDLFYQLGARGIQLSRFSACTGSVEGESRILKAMGRPPEEREYSLRISLGRHSRREDFFRLKSCLKEFLSL